MPPFSRWIKCYFFIAFIFFLCYFGIITLRLCIMTINLKQYAKECKRIQDEDDYDFPRQKVKWMQTHLTPEDVIKICRKIHGHYFFTTGSCGVLSCVLDILFRNETSRFVILFSVEDKDKVDEVTEEHEACHGQLVSSLGYELGFDHVLWMSDGLCYDISYKRDLLDIIASEWVDIDEDDGTTTEPYPIYISPNKNIGYDDAIFHQKILQGTSYEITINGLLNEIHDYHRSHDSIHDRTLA